MSKKLLLIAGGVGLLLWLRYRSYNTAAPGDLYSPAETETARQNGFYVP